MLLQVSHCSPASFVHSGLLFASSGGKLGEQWNPRDGPGHLLVIQVLLNSGENSVQTEASSRTNSPEHVSLEGVDCQLSPLYHLSEKH